MCQASTCGQVLAPSLVDESWYQLTNVLISAFSTDLKRIQTPYTLFWDFGPDKPLHQVYNPLVRMHSSSLSPSSLLPVIWQSLTKAIPEDNRKFDCKINGKALGAALLHSLGGLGGASINTGCFRVFGSRCWTLPACSKKTFYYSCHSDSVRQPKRFS